MATRSLTATQVAAIRGDGQHRVAPGLYLNVKAEKGTRSWLFRYTIDGKNVWMGLGAVADKSLTEARDEAALLRVEVRRGGDPLADKRDAKAQRAARHKPQTPTFDECAKQYILSHQQGWKNEKHHAQWKSTLRD